MTFPDHFSTLAAQYATSRPRYPDGLFLWLAASTPARALAWDAGCGNGQASVGLAAHFDRVVATDGSAQQVANADLRANITYDVRGETNPVLTDASLDLVTIAQALHWFDRTAFYREVARVLKPGGVLAAWTYALSRIDPAIDVAVHEWYRGALHEYWPAERLHVETQYRDIGFPYRQIPTPVFDMSVQWTRAQFIAYLRTWSAVKEYARRTGGDAMLAVLPALCDAWSDEQVRLVRWPLNVLAGHNRTATQT